MGTTILYGHIQEQLQNIPDRSVDCIMTFPPDYIIYDSDISSEVWDEVPGCSHVWQPIRMKPIGSGSRGRYSVSRICSECGAWKGRLGQEPTVAMYIGHLNALFDACRRVLKDTGALWVGISDTYDDDAGWYHSISDNHIENIELRCVPDRLKVALSDNRWLCQNEIIWYGANRIPASTKNRFIINHDKLYLFTKQRDYYFKQQYANCKGRGLHPMRSVWHVGGEDPCLKLFEVSLSATVPKGGTVLDIFARDGGVLFAAEKLGFNTIGVEPERVSDNTQDEDSVIQD